MAKELIVYAVIITYEDYSQDLDNIYPTEESAKRHAQKLLSHNNVIEVQVDEDTVTEEYGRGWKKTVYRETKQKLG